MVRNKTTDRDELQAHLPSIIRRHLMDKSKITVNSIDYIQYISTTTKVLKQERAINVWGHNVVKEL